MHVVATAGHVDHGKSTLIKALTGTDPDRLEEEKARGLTIDLGFAGAKLPSGRGISFIDVPGHVRFLKNMLAGVGGVDACIFVVAATEGWKPQSEEHLRILSLLGIRHGIVALTKVGHVDDELVTIAQMEIADRTEGTFLGDAPIVPVDAIDGHGMDDLMTALDQLLDVTPTARDDKKPRLWIDRVFAAKGAGTVVTGTLTGGMVRVEDELSVLPQNAAVRVRGLQSQYADRTKVGPGNRVAANLSGVSHDQLRRGDVLVRPDDWHVTHTVDASLQVLESLDRPVTRRGAHLLYLGSGEHPVRVRVLGPDAIEPGATGAVRMHLPIGLPLVPGDRFILRESGQGVTLGGGEILDVDPIVPASRANPDRDVERVVRERGRVDIDHLRRLTGERREPDVGRWAVDPTALAATAGELRELYPRFEDFCRVRAEFDPDGRRDLGDVSVVGSILLRSMSSPGPCLRRSTTSPSTESGPEPPTRSTCSPTATWSPDSRPIRFHLRILTTSTRPRSASSSAAAPLSRKVVWSLRQAQSTRRPGSSLGCWPTSPMGSPSLRPAMVGGPRASSRFR